MAENITRPGRPLVRVLNSNGAGGSIDHMTIDELYACAVGDNFDGRCPACGMFHLTRTDIEAVVSEKIRETEDYTTMKKEVEEDSDQKNVINA